ncbi:MAG: hypothetical protein AB7S36_19980, partial [Planctomycetota bacterium]
MTATLEPTPAVPELTEWDHHAWQDIVRVDLSPEQMQRIVTPAAVHPLQTSVLAVHWHPEFVPVDLIRQRIEATFPNKRTELIIPTQHNVITSYGDLSGVEIDCYARSFQRKVQFLAHFEKSKTDSPAADKLRSMLKHTFQYRTGQLWEFINTLLEPSLESRMQEAARKTGADEKMVAFVRQETRKVRELIHVHMDTTPAEAIRNKALKWWFDALRAQHSAAFIDRVQVFVQAVKEVVKRHFNLEYFYEAHEIIEEVRGLGGCIVIPHPEQFWPALLEDYDVDAWEVWNPQSREYTEFLINALIRENHAGRHRRPILITMGDDCHMGEKVRDPSLQDTEKSRREIGVQPPWSDMPIQKALRIANI